MCSDRASWSVAAAALVLLLLSPLMVRAGEWARIYDHEESDDLAVDVAVDGFGNSFVLATCMDDDDDPDVVVVRYSAAGERTGVWVHDGGPSDRAVALALDIVPAEGRNAIYVTAEAGYDFLTLKFDAGSSGAPPDWAVPYSGISYDSPVDIAVHPQGYFVVVTGIGMNAIDCAQYVTVRYDADGTQRWVRYHNSSVPGEGAVPAGVVIDDDGYVYVTGTSYREATGKDVCTIKYHPLPSQVDPLWMSWFDLDDDGGPDEALGIALCGNGLVVTGTCYTDDYQGDDVLGLGIRLLDGHTHSNNYDGESRGEEAMDDFAKSMTTRYVQNDDKWYVYIVAECELPEGRGWDETHRVIRWEVRTTEPYHYVHILSTTPSADFYAEAGSRAGVAADADGNVYVTGIQDRDEVDILVWRLAPPSLELNWTRYCDSEGTEDEAAAVAVAHDQTGDVGIAVTGSIDEEDVVTMMLSLDFQQWTQLADLLEGSGKKVRQGACMAPVVWTGGPFPYPRIYALKGNRTIELQYFDGLDQSWHAAADITTTKPVSYGGAMCSDGGEFVYAIPGNRSLEFRAFEPSANKWYTLPDAPAGPRNRAFKKGACLAYVEDENGSYVYAIKGNRDRWLYRYVILSAPYGKWEVLEELPPGKNNRLWKWHHCLAWDGGDNLYLVKGRFNELFRCDLTCSPGQDRWTQLEDVPWRKPGGSGYRRVRKEPHAAFGPGLYLLKSSSTRDLWQYLPGPDIWVTQEDIPSGRKVKWGGELTWEPLESKFYALSGYRWESFMYDPGGIVPPEPPAEGWNSARPDLSVRDRLGRRTPSSTKRPSGPIRGYPRPSSPEPSHLRHRRALASSAPGVFEVDTVFDANCEGAPAWSPDGQWVVYVRFDSTFGWDRLFLFNPWTGEEYAIGQPPAHADNPQWSPCGEWVVYQAHVPSGFTQVYKSPVSPGGDPIQLTSGPEDHECPQWSPDGQYVVYQAGDLEGFVQIWYVSAAGTGSPVQVTTGYVDHELPRTFWSMLGPTADSTWDVVYQAEDAEGFWQVFWFEDVLGSSCGSYAGETQLTFSAFDHINPCPPNPNGDVIYQKDDEYGVEWLWRVPLSSPGSEASVGGDPIADSEHPDVSPDGLTVLCDRDFHQEDGFSVPAVVVLELMVYGETSDTLTDPFAERIYPRYSPDGSAVVVQWTPLGFGLAGAVNLKPKQLSGFSFSQASANPCHGNVRLRWQVPTPGRVTAVLYDRVGRLVRTLVDTPVAGSGSAVWDRTDAAGHHVPAGVYFCDFRAGEYHSRTKLVLVE